MSKPLLIVLFVLSSSVFSAPKLLVSITPIHSIVSDITQGISKPKLLLKPSQSAHHAHLTPSQLSLIHQADLIITLHPNFEEGLLKTLKQINKQKWFIINENISNHHTWLSVNRMQIFAKKITSKLKVLDKNNASKYQANYLKLEQKLLTLKNNIKQILKNISQPIASYSNAFEYFIKENNLNQTTLISTQHGQRLSIHTIIKAKKSMQSNHVKCLLSTSSVPLKRINTLTEGLNINTARINIISTHQYIPLMNNIANKAAQCLQ